MAEDETITSCGKMHYHFWSKISLPIFKRVRNVSIVYCDQAICGSLGTTSAGACAY